MPSFIQEVNEYCNVCDKELSMYAYEYEKGVDIEKYKFSCMGCMCGLHTQPLVQINDDHRSALYINVPGRHVEERGYELKLENIPSYGI